MGIVCVVVTIMVVPVMERHMGRSIHNGLPMDRIRKEILQAATGDDQQLRIFDGTHLPGLQRIIVQTGDLLVD